MDHFIAFLFSKLIISQMKKEVPQQTLQHYFNYFSEKAPTLVSKMIQGISAAGLFFGLLGLLWSIPFPHLNFLGQYNSYFNWASFGIAFTVYYYSKLSPLLSYLMLFLTLVFAYVISLVEIHFTKGNLILTQLYLLIFIAFAVIRYLTLKMSGKNSTLKMELLFILIGPIWFLHFILKKLSIKY